MPNITTSLPFKWYNLAKELHISWNQALIRGIKEFSEEPYNEKGEEKIINESYKSKLINVQRTMQKTIDELNEKIEKK